MRILALTHTYPRFPADTNGPFVRFLMDELARRGHEVRILTAWDRGFDPAELERDLDGRGRARARLSAYRYAPWDAWHLLGYSRTIREDVRLRTRMLLLSPLMLAAGARALRRAAQEFRPDLLHAHWFLPNAFMAAGVARRLGLPLVATLHGSDVFVAEKGWPFSHMTRVALRATTRLTSCSPELRDRVCALGLDRRRSHVIPYAADPGLLEGGIDPAAAARMRERLLAGAPGPLVLALGRLVWKKGFHVLLEALPPLRAQHPGLRVAIAGEGDLAERLKTMVRERGLQLVVDFPGRLSREEVGPAMAACDLFVMPSVHDEAGNVDGLPNVILEAMAARRAVVASEVAGIPLAVRHGVTGLLAAPDDPRSLKQALRLALSDAEVRRRWGEAGRALIESELNWPAVAARYEEIYRLARADGPGGAGSRTRTRLDAP
ncbi:MAG: glycosyltransferase [bacterium]|nr:glycosyltransferase [bacterium]